MLPGLRLLTLNKIIIKKPLPNQTLPQEQPSRRPWGSTPCPGFRGWKTKPPVKEKTEKNTRAQPGPFQKGLFNRALAERLEAADGQPGPGPGWCWPPHGCHPCWGGWGGLGGTLWGTGLWAPCLWGREGALLSRAPAMGCPKTHCERVPAPGRAGRVRGHVPLQGGMWLWLQAAAAVHEGVSG